jgi:hypothetical protein
VDAVIVTTPTSTISCETTLSLVPAGRSLAAPGLVATQAAYVAGFSRGIVRPPR